MSQIQPFNFNELESILISDDSNVGTCIGISNPVTKTWRFSIYIGSDRLLILFEKGKGVNQQNFDKLIRILNLTPEKLKNDLDVKESATKLDVFLVENLSFDIYLLNIFDICQKEKIKPRNFIETLKYNLNQCETLDEGDIVAFDRTIYSHHAIVTDISRMICTHRSGEPENLAGPLIASTSILGLPTEKALVTEDFIINIAGHRRMTKSNEKYDSCHMPKPKEEILAEARKRIGEKGYSLRTKNCQHWCSEVRNGTSYSPEVEGVMNGVKLSFGLIGAAAVLGMAMNYFSAGKENQNKKKEKIQEIQNQ